MGFKKGDKAIVVGNINAPQLNGTICTVTSNLIANPVSGIPIHWTDIHWDGNHWDYYAIQPNYLRHIPDGNDEASWDEIERITDWHPEAITV